MPTSFVLTSAVSVSVSAHTDMQVETCIVSPSVEITVVPFTVEAT